MTLNWKFSTKETGVRTKMAGNSRFLDIKIWAIGYFGIERDPSYLKVYEIGRKGAQSVMSPVRLNAVGSAAHLLQVELVVLSQPLYTVKPYSSQPTKYFNAPASEYVIYADTSFSRWCLLIERGADFEKDCTTCKGTRSLMARYPNRLAAHRALMAAVKEKSLEVRYTERVLSELQHHKWATAGNVKQWMSNMGFVHQVSGLAWQEKDDLAAHAMEIVGLPWEISSDNDKNDAKIFLEANFAAQLLPENVEFALVTNNMKWVLKFNEHVEALANQMGAYGAARPVTIWDAEEYGSFYM
ncbi:hypothetical protein HK097_000150 [Rhizophlyctis rosea]|uniref:Uncharacterized protein n=1 Tax=Rhizophlyctis rosea TaxID=64517 RepID=A0AAD5X2T6_9FUNG|nr:hypothetical protein HK097_000150 [Rhizophlyctis rosea]